MRNSLLPVIVMASACLFSGCGALLHPIGTAVGLARAAASTATGAAHGMVGAARNITGAAMNTGSAATSAAIRTTTKAAAKALEIAPYVAAAAL